MEVKINGDQGPSVRFRIGLMAIIQVFVVLAVFATAMKVTQADVERMKTNQTDMQEQLKEIDRKQSQMLAVIESLRDEIRYYREKLDRHIEAHRNASR